MAGEALMNFLFICKFIFIILRYEKHIEIKLRNGRIYN